jgi:sec-independent protein translocase protein TatA
MGYLIIALVVLVLFGRGKISAMMGEMGKGHHRFQKRRQRWPARD